MNPTRTTRAQRYWFQRAGKYIVDEYGFLVDPEGPFRTSLKAGLVPLADLDDRDCLVLLGEPGMGKTTAIEAERERRERQIDATGDLLIWRNLSEYGEESRLIRDLFETQEWDRWRDGDQTIHLYLDALDECRLHLHNVLAVILGQLRRVTLPDRLKLRIACRTGAWPHHLEAGLKEVWPGDRTGVFELAPLRRHDVEEIAAGSGVDDIGAFLSDVEGRGAGPLAAKPITLKLLVNIYRRGGQLPNSQAELYDLGCRALCEETNQSRRAAGWHGLLGVDERLAVAARIAAAMVFCGRSAVWDGPDLASQPNDDIAVPDLGGVEPVRGADFRATEAGIREVLSDTGLFSSRGPGRMGWAHRTFAEYLAARYLHTHGLGIEQIKDLVLHPHMPGRVVPQLQQTTVWLAGMAPEVFYTILESDPEVLIRGDLEVAADEDREELVAALLEAASSGRLGGIDLDTRRQYHKLRHPRLAAQLSPFIDDRSRGPVARRIAIDIARACEVRELQGPLADRMLDRTEELNIRVGSGYAVWKLGEEAARRRAVSLLETDLDEDVEDELKGCALRALWPGLISAGKVFRAITPPKRENFYGTYADFLADDLVRGLDRADLPVALAWAVKQGGARGLPHVFRLAINQLVLRAWEEIEMPGIADALAGIVWSRIVSHTEVIDSLSAGAGADPFGADTNRRRRLIRAIIPTLKATSGEPGCLGYSRPPLMAAADLTWLIGLLDSEEDPETRAILARIARVVFLLPGPRSPDEILAAAERHPEVADAMRDLISPVALDSPVAVAARKTRADLKSAELRYSASRTLNISPRDWVEELLAREQEGDPDAWRGLTLVMTMEPPSNSYKDILRSDLTALPGWRQADENTRGRIIEAAHRYVLGHQPSPDRWFFREGACYSPDEAGFKALRLVSEQGSDRCDALDPDVWSKWSPVIVGYPNSGDLDNEEAQRRLAVHAYRHAPAELLNWLDRWLREQGRR